MQPTYKEFLEACRTGDLDTVERALAKFNIHRIIDGFMSAVRHGKLNVVNRLLDIDIVRKPVSWSRNLVLIEATNSGHLAIVNRLLEIPAVLQYAATDDNAALRVAVDKGHLDVARRLLNITAVRKNVTQDFIKKHQGVDKIIEDIRMAPIVAAQGLSNSCGSEYITNHILALAYHDVLCGKADCTKPAQTQEEGLITCPVINQFRNYALGAKARAQAKIEQMTSSSTN